MPLIKVDDVKFVKELYPRFELDNYSVNQYRQSIDLLPPILISRSNTLIDGYHRLIAHKLEEREEIEVEYFESDDENEIFIEAIKRNNSHGKQLSIDEKQKLTPILYNKDISIEEIALILAIGKTKVYGWTKTIRDKEREERDAEAFELYLQCWTQEQIADKLDVNQATVSRVMQDSIDGKMHTPDNLQLYNLWSVGRLSQTQLKYPGQTPQDIVENLIYYYTEPPQINPHIQISKVVDPMAGSGIVRDACRKLMRKYQLYDIKPVREDIPIKKNDVLKGLPDEAKNTDLVYFDPPYYNLMSEYPDNGFTGSYEEFLHVMKLSFNNFLPILNEGGRVALILKPMNEEMLAGDWLDLTIDCTQIAREMGYVLEKRITAPLSTQQFKAHDVTRAKERRIMLNTLRDIVILRRP